MAAPLVAVMIKQLGMRPANGRWRWGVPATVLCLLACPVAGAAQELDLRIAGADIAISASGDDFQVRAAAVVDWVRRSAQIVGDYYGRYPVRTLLVRVKQIAGSDIGHGQAFASASPLIRVELGRDVSTAALRDDWVLPHEMVHLALPDVGDDHRWLAEGLATYVEGIARVQAGNMTETDLWAEYVRAMPKGLPAAGDQGLDRTHTWGRTYWGGALFCLVADVNIRRQTGLRRGLQDALRAVARESGGMTAVWPIERVLAVGDAATGTHALSDLYASMRGQPAAPDLAELWRALGVELTNDGVRLREDAPDAGARKAITRRQAP